MHDASFTSVHKVLQVILVFFDISKTSHRYRQSNGALMNHTTTEECFGASGYWHFVQPGYKAHKTAAADIRRGAVGIDKGSSFGSPLRLLAELPLPHVVNGTEAELIGARRDQAVDHHRRGLGLDIGQQDRPGSICNKQVSHTSHSFALTSRNISHFRQRNESNIFQRFRKHSEGIFTFMAVIVLSRRVTI